MNKELYHHGILGQKWGVRRFQNANGSLTSAGKRRYNKDTSRNSEVSSGAKSKSGTKAVKTAIAIGTTAAVTSLAVIGMSKLSQVKSKADLGCSVVNTSFNIADTSRNVVNVNRSTPKMSRQDAKRMKELMNLSRTIANQRISQYGTNYFH